MFIIYLKPPAGPSVWSGPSTATGTIPRKENDRQRTKREAIGVRIEAICGEEPAFNARKYTYAVQSLSSEQKTEIEGVAGVRRIEEK